jgi:hypothetical protein
VSVKIPKEIFIGDSVTWLDDETCDMMGNVIASDLWTLKYAIRGATTLDLTATAHGDGWSTTISTVNSSAFSAGVYYWQAFATDASNNRVTLGTGQITVHENLAAATSGYDGRSQIRQDLDAVKLAVRTMIAGGAVQEYMIGTRSVKKMSLTDLLALESKLKVDLAREEKADKIRNGLGNPHNLGVRFR